MNYYYKYLKYKDKYNQLKNELNNEVVNQVGGKKDIPELYLFKAEWCGHCKSFKDTWKKLEETMGKNINFIAYDSEKNSKEIKEWQVTGFPTIIYRKNDKAIEYNGPREFNSLVEFVNSN
jgi:thiol-disulfide isomerase/thioredoxin